MTDNQEVDSVIEKVLGNVILGLVCDKVTLPQAVKAVDDAVDGITLPDDERMELKTRLLEHVFTLFRIRDEQRRETQDERMAEEAVAKGYGLVGPIVERPETHEEWGQRMWDGIKAHLPESMYADPETERKNAWRIGFLLGYGGEHLGAKLLRWLWRLP